MRATTASARASPSCLIDLDRFKPINDIHGHSAGDLVLCEIANRLKDVVRKNDTLVADRRRRIRHRLRSRAQIGGDSKEIILFAERVIDAVRAPVVDRRESRSRSTPASASHSARPTGAIRKRSCAPPTSPCTGRSAAGAGLSASTRQSMDEELRARAALEADVRQRGRDRRDRAPLPAALRAVERTSWSASRCWRAGTI